MTLNARKIKHCRSCKKKKLNRVLSLGNLSFTGIFPSKENETIPKGPLELVICNYCKLVQLQHNFNLKYMYGKNYGYRSSLNKTMVQHLKNKASSLSKYLKNNNNTIIDIGSNDGTLLSFFNKKNKIIGIDPTIKKFKKFYRKDIIQVQEFFPPKKFKVNDANLITSIACFYDLTDPIKFAKKVYSSLDENGIWHFEQSYLPKMINNLSYDTICHEHLEYYSLRSLKYIMDRTNFKIVDIQFNKINGGSIALTVAKDISKFKETSKVKKILKLEKKNKIHSKDYFSKFSNNIKINSKKFKKFLKDQNNKKKIFACLGASTKGNVILQYEKLDKRIISFVYEVNSNKFNHYTPGTKIKILPERNIKKNNPDYLIVLPWHFSNFFIKNKKRFFNNISLIFPLPKFRVV